jgi:hypothetical protein
MNLPRNISPGGNPLPRVPKSLKSKPVNPPIISRLPYLPSKSLIGKKSSPIKLPQTPFHRY